MLRLTMEDIVGSAISPLAWLAWVSQDVLTKLPHNTKVMISNINGLWIISNEKLDILWSSEPIELEGVVGYSPSIASEKLIQQMMAAVSPDPDFKPGDDISDSDDVI